MLRNRYKITFNGHRFEDSFSAIALPKIYPRFNQLSHIQVGVGR